LQDILPTDAVLKVTSTADIPILQTQSAASQPACPPPTITTSAWLTKSSHVIENKQQEHDKNAAQSTQITVAWQHNAGFAL